MWDCHARTCPTDRDAEQHGGRHRFALAVNILINLQHSELVLPAIALIVGLRFSPIAWAAPFRTFYIPCGSLVLSAGAGFILPAPGGGIIAGLMAAGSLWIAAVLAVRQAWRTGQSCPGIC